MTEHDCGTDAQRHCCIKRSAHLTWSTCSPRSLAAGRECPVCCILQDAGGAYLVEAVRRCGRPVPAVETDRRLLVG